LGRQKLVATTPSLPFNSIRNFSAHHVVDILQREHAEELENPDTNEMPPDLAELQSTVQNDWKVVDDGALTKLHRALPNIKVQISFHCQDTVETAPAYDEEEEQEEPMEETAVPIRFTVALTKAGKTLLMTCVTDPDHLSVAIQSVAISMDDVSDLQESGGAVLANQYQGPEFTELAEDLQDAFHDYLQQQVGISEDLVSFITMYCDWKEQQEYVKFLEDAKALLG
jgi:complement component 1 Q subcomponent-binding protein